MKKINLLMFAGALLSLTSCLKDGKVNLAPGASPSVVEWSTAVVALVPSASATTSPYTLYTTSYDALPSVNQALQVGYTGGGNTSSDITVNLAASSAALEAYNVANFGPRTTTAGVPIPANVANYYVELPSTLYTLPASVTIPAGGNKGNVTMAIKTASFDFSKKYAVALSITSVSGTSAAVSGNYGTIILAPGAKNKYDGVYTVTGTLFDNVNASITATSPMTQQLRTQTATAVAEYDGYLVTNGYAHPISNATSYYGSYSPMFTMDANDNVVSVPNYFGQPASNGRSGRIDPTGINKWTISGNSKVMKVSYIMQGPGNVDRTFFVETWTYTGPR